MYISITELLSMDYVYGKKQLLGSLQFTIFALQIMAGLRFNLRTEHTSSTFDSASHTLNRNRYLEFSFQNVDVAQYS
jgi:hypothetical protein